MSSNYGKYLVSVGVQCEEILLNSMEDTENKNSCPQENELPASYEPVANQLDSKEPRVFNGMTTSIEERDSLDGDVLIRSDVSNTDKDFSSIHNETLMKDTEVKMFDQESQYDLNMAIRANTETKDSEINSDIKDETTQPTDEEQLQNNSDKSPPTSKDNLLYSIIDKSEPFYLSHTGNLLINDERQDDLSSGEYLEQEPVTSDGEDENNELPQSIKTLESSYVSDDVPIYSPPPSFTVENSSEDVQPLTQNNLSDAENATEVRDDSSEDNTHVSSTNTKSSDGGASEFQSEEINQSDAGPLNFPIEISADIGDEASNDEETNFTNAQNTHPEPLPGVDDKLTQPSDESHITVEETQNHFPTKDEMDEINHVDDKPVNIFEIDLPEGDQQELIKTFESMVEEECDELINNFDDALKQFEEDERNLGVFDGSSQSLTDSRESSSPTVGKQLIENKNDEPSVIKKSLPVLRAKKPPENTTRIPKVSEKSNSSKKTKEPAIKRSNKPEDRTKRTETTRIKKSENRVSTLKFKANSKTTVFSSVQNKNNLSNIDSHGSIKKEFSEMNINPVSQLNEMTTDPNAENSVHSPQELSREPSEASFSSNENESKVSSNQGQLYSSQNSTKHKKNTTLLKQRSLNDTGRCGSGQITLPVKETIATKKRREQFEARQKEIQEKKQEEEYATPLQRKEAEIKDLRQKLGDLFCKVSSLEEEIDKFLLDKSRDTNSLLSQCSARIAALELEISELEEANQECDNLIKKLREENSQHENHLVELKNEHERLKQRSQDLYLTIHKKGKCSAVFEREVELEKLAREFPKKVTESELKSRLEATKQEIEKWKGIKLAERYTNTEKPKTEEEARLKFMRDSMFHYLTEQKKDLINEHLQALIKMCGFTDVQSKNITKALDDKRKQGKL